MANPANLTINETSANGAINQPTLQPVDTNGTINCPVKSLTDRLLIEVVNTDDAALTVTVKAGTGTAAHTARSDGCFNGSRRRISCESYRSARINAIRQSQRLD